MYDKYDIRMLNQLAALRMLIKAALIQRICRKYDANQPRVPAGSSDGGQWTDADRMSVAGKWDPKRLQ